MSVRINLTELDDEKQKDINKFLTFVPENKKVFKKNQFYSNEVTVPVKMYFTKNSKVHIPYTFCKLYYKKDFNTHSYPILNVTEFNGTLLPRQEEPYKEALNHLSKHRTTTIALYPGFGKTFMGVKLSHSLNLWTCILVHRESVGKQWVKTFKNCMPYLKDKVWFVSDKMIEDPKIIICMDGRVDKIPQKVIDNIGLLIIDEAHCFCSSSRVRPMLAFSPKYIIAETATPEKDNGMHKMIQSICGIHYIKKISNKSYNFYILNTKLDFVTAPGKYLELINLQCDSEERNNIITNIVEQNKHFKTIIITNRVHHCKLLKKQLESKNIESSELYGSIKNYVPKNVLIGTGSKMGVGFDEANFCDKFDGRPSDLLIMCYTIANWATFEQIRGRGMRADKPNVLIFNDKNQITKKHMTQIRKWVKETNGNIIELNISKLNDFKLNFL